MSAKFWISIEQDDEGNLVVLDGNDELVAKMARTKPADGDAPDNKWAEVLVGDVERLGRFAMAVLVKKDNSVARFD